MQFLRKVFLAADGWEDRRGNSGESEPISRAQEFRRFALQIPGTDIKVKLRECSPVINST
jgi:hypothetical protein